MVLLVISQMELRAIYQTCKPLVLASASPRRQQYFDALGITYLVHAANIKEECLPEEKPLSFVQRMAAEKARVVMAHYPQRWIVAADTVVSLADAVLGKPKDRADALCMLMSLAGKEHRVHTGICLTCHQQAVFVVQSVTTRVVFRPFSENEARAYVATGEPLDKAGAYGIQGQGAFLIQEISGSYSNVVGFPLGEMIPLLAGYGVIAVCSEIIA